MASIQVRSQFLRQWQPEGESGAHRGFQIVAENATACSAAKEERPKGHWRQRDVKRAIAAAEQAGLASYRVEIAPEGTISIIVGDPSQTAPERHPDG